MRILFVTARFPYPPLKGDQVRAFHQLRLLSRKHCITLVCFNDGQVPRSAWRKALEYCEEVMSVPLRRSTMIASLLGGSLSRYPFQTLLYRSNQMGQEVQSLLHGHEFDVVHVQPIRMAPYVENEEGIPRVIDLIDALSLNMKRRYQLDRSILKLAAYVESRRLIRYERAVCEKFDQVTVVSRTDQSAIGSYDNLHVNPNGVNLEDFPFIVEGRKPRSLIFGGNMGYFPNVHAVCWFAQEVLPLIKSEIPDVKFYVVGANPHSDVRKLVKRDSAVVVTGFVRSMQAYLAQFAAAIAPIQAGSGIQNKILEAMACGTPIVATPSTLSGIEAIDGEHLLVAEDAAAFANQVIRVLNDADLRLYLAHKARRLVEEKYTWERSVAMLEAVYWQAMECVERREN